MKLFLLAALVAVCTASTLYRGKNITVNDDGTILITSASGKRVEITRPVGFNGQRNIDIAISGPNVPTKRIQVNDDTLYDSEVRTSGQYPWSSVDSVDEEQRLKRGTKKDKNQGDVLSEILGEYQGPLDDVLYERLLGKVNKAVRKGEISSQIYDLLSGLDQVDNGGVLNTIVPSGVYGNGQILPWYNGQIPQIQVQGQVPSVAQRVPYLYPLQNQYINPLYYQDQIQLQGQVPIIQGLPYYYYQQYLPLQSQYINPLLESQYVNTLPQSQYINPLLQRIYSQNQDVVPQSLVSSSRIGNSLWGQYSSGQQIPSSRPISQGSRVGGQVLGSYPVNSYNQPLNSGLGLRQGYLGGQEQTTGLGNGRILPNYLRVPQVVY